MSDTTTTQALGVSGRTTVTTIYHTAVVAVVSVGVVVVTAWWSVLVRATVVVAG